MVYRPIFHRPLYALAASALALALATDLTYYVSTDFIWVDMSDWLVSIGAVVGFLALIVGVVETMRAPRGFGFPWVFGLLSLLAWAAAVLNMFVHSRDGLTSVEPQGLVLSALTCVLLFFAWWSQVSAESRHHAEPRQFAAENPA